MIKKNDIRNKCTEWVVLNDIFFREVVVSTPFGSPSAPIVEGRVDGVDVCMLARHGLEHTILPGDINYRANIWALKVEGGGRHTL